MDTTDTDKDPYRTPAKKREPVSITFSGKVVAQITLGERGRAEGTEEKENKGFGMLAGCSGRDGCAEGAGGGGFRVIFFLMVQFFLCSRPNGPYI